MKNRNQFFPVVRYFTWKLELVSNILWMIVGNHIKAAINSIQYNTIFWRPLSKEMFGKSLKFFGQPTTKWRSCKIFAKLNGNHLLMANFFKLQEYKTFGLMKMHNMSKIWFANNKFSLPKVWFTINRPSKMLLLIFVFFIFPNFKWLLSKLLWKNNLFYNGFRGSYEVLLRQKYFWSTHFWQWNDFLLKCFEVCSEMHLVSLLFLNERNITISLLIIHFKCTVVHYVNLNSRSASKPLLNYRPWNMLFFFDFLFRVILTRLLSKILWKN